MLQSPESKQATKNKGGEALSFLALGQIWKEALVYRKDSVGKM